MNYNGQDGIDTNFPTSTIRNNSISHNGWQGDTGDRNGILLCSNKSGAFSGTVITSNFIYQNDENGIDLNGLCGVPVANVTIEENNLTGNDGWAVSYDSSVSGIGVFDNDAGGNQIGCYHLPTTGVTRSGNFCQGLPPLSVDIVGPTVVNGVSENCSWTAFASGGFPPYDYEWIGIIVGTGGTIYATPQESGYLGANVRDVENNADGSAVYVTVDPDEPPCTEGID